MKKAILLLPGNVLITIPALILYCNGFQIITLKHPLLFCLMIFCFASGLTLLIWTIKLFADVGCGSLAPWNPVNKLITVGPYAHVRNPMLSGVFLCLGGEALLFQSKALGWYSLLFIIINLIYFPLLEEKDLHRRFGSEYETYKNNVPRFIPRIFPHKR